MITAIVRVLVMEPLPLMSLARHPIGAPVPTREVERWVAVETWSPEEIMQHIREDLVVVEGARP